MTDDRDHIILHMNTDRDHIILHVITIGEMHHTVSYTYQIEISHTIPYHGVSV